MAESIPVTEPDAAASGTPCAATVGNAEDAGQVCRFVAHGLLREPCRIDLVQASGPVPRSNLDVALLAAAADPLFDTLERWLEVSFDVSSHDDADGPADGASTAPAPLRVRLSTGDAESPELCVHLPRRALGFLPPIPKAIARSTDIRLDALSALCRVARFAVGADELAELTPGAVLLLPESFDATWPVRLIARGVSARYHLDADEWSLALASERLERVGRGLREAGAKGHRDGDDGECDVDIVLDGPLAWDPIAVLGGAGESAPSLPAPLARCRFRCLVGGRGHLVGRIAAVGDGYGFFAFERLPDAAALTQSTDGKGTALPPTDED